MLEAMAMQAARRRGLQDHRLILRRVRCAIGVRLASRAARMVLGCIPRLAAEDAFLFGEPSGADDAHRAQPRQIVLIDGEADALPLVV